MTRTRADFPEDLHFVHAPLGPVGAPLPCVRIVENKTRTNYKRAYPRCERRRGVLDKYLNECTRAACDIVVMGALEHTMRIARVHPPKRALSKYAVDGFFV